ncbi:ankyrin repeat domain-containing protein 40-like [Megalops cyprinoides]|uniref:ankyrin repeat domain-containing protein 40-like n=1 Tax=Megalops cyprinoides TaxID=118141 RepID=UPI0018648FB2|nr:ankyrin repeat domain-containing protein 40-like [Megalops cyprinoides]
MSVLSVDKELQERLREASAIGDIDEVRVLVESGVNVNSQNEINGWTCLHWACKRNHGPVVAYLLNSGADKEILTSKGELAVQLTSKPEIRRLLGVEEEVVPEVKEPELPIIPNYLSNPPFPYGKTDTEDLILESHISSNGVVDQEPVCGEATSPVHSLPNKQEPSSFPNTEEQRQAAHVPVPEQNGCPQSALRRPVSEIHQPNHREHAQTVAQTGPACPSLPSSNGSASSQVDNSTVNRQQPVPPQLNCSQAGMSVPAFQPFFFASTFPVNVQELVLKVRIQNPNARENDFIEVELDRQELTYRSLLRVCCRELGISSDHVEKIRKLPNTMLRKDKDVARLQDFQELEVVLERAESLSLLSAGGQGSLTDKPCYNLKASKLTY